MKKITRITPSPEDILQLQKWVLETHYISDVTDALDEYEIARFFSYDSPTALAEINAHAEGIWEGSEHYTDTALMHAIRADYIGLTMVYSLGAASTAK